MISKPLFKQSCKANGTMWAIITFAVCFMLVCVMTIGGSGALDSTKTAIQNTIIKGELQSQTESRALNYYELSESGLEYFDEQFKTELASVQQTDQFKQVYTNQGEDAAKQYASSVAYKNAVTDLQKYAVQVATEKGYQANSDEAVAGDTDADNQTAQEIAANEDAQSVDTENSENESAQNTDESTSDSNASSQETAETSKRLQRQAVMA